jgi:invasion protein IalB
MCSQSHATRAFFSSIAQVIFFAASVAASNAHAQDVKARFGAWNLICKGSGNASEQDCAISQAVQSDDAHNSTIAILVRKSPITKNGLFQIVVPEGVILPEGVKFKIDQTDIGQLAFFKCFPAGCVAEGIIDDGLLEKFKNGRIGVLTIYFNPDQGLRHLFKLDGFKEGFNSLN